MSDRIVLQQLLLTSRIPATIFEFKPPVPTKYGNNIYKRKDVAFKRHKPANDKEQNYN